MELNLGRSIRLMLSSTLRGGGSTLTIIQDDHHYEHNDDDESDADVSNELRKHLDDFAATLKKNQSVTDIDGIFNKKLSEMVHGSNMIEAVGSSLDITSELCRGIFEGGIGADDTEISNRDPIYQPIRADLIEKKKPNAHEDVLRSWREVVQHAKAAYYIMNEVAIKGSDLSEEAVRDLTASLKTDITVAEAIGEIDPVALAAKYCHKFVNIHPFLDGNSRTSRLILNTILLKYGGCFVWFGKDAAERDEYMNIPAAGFAAEAMDTQEEMDDLPDEFKPKHHKKLATFTLKHVYKYLSLFN
ncbi:Adenosine monophosphate-protein transferase FICD like protein [Fusarium oxysporum f. sp. cubense race 1]|uniref:Adenosine monophosphate-protein transferase FICD like protein n=1 Tax=Fusarium oxysporum f. sp. cubense (strain race 1) TaxID=1229664 RepID=N4TZX3_FUSC1|nr:Adenosine monophosphate-protein transferase FICD like protein [Fusarium oxysporum f. sp. cubense race 1]